MPHPADQSFTGWPALRHLPFPVRQGAVGVRPVAVAGWFELDDLAGELAHKLGTLDRVGDAAGGVLAVAEAACTELAAEVARSLGVRLEGTGLAAASALVVDDLCILSGAGDDAGRLIAAAVAAPNRWSPAHKLGRPLVEVHGPVPGYADTLARPVARVIGGLVPGRVLERRNWSMLDDDALWQPVGSSDPATPFDPDRWFLRVERQTLRRLPRTGAVVFTIRTRQWPMRFLTGHPPHALGLADALATSPPQLLAYKGIAHVAAEAAGWLRTSVAPP